MVFVYWWVIFLSGVFLSCLLIKFLCFVSSLLVVFDLMLRIILWWFSWNIRLGIVWKMVCILEFVLIIFCEFNLSDCFSIVWLVLDFLYVLLILLRNLFYFVGMLNFLLKWCLSCCFRRLCIVFIFIFLKVLWLLLFGCVVCIVCWVWMGKFFYRNKSLLVLFFY